MVKTDKYHVVYVVPQLKNKNRPSGQECWVLASEMKGGLGVSGEGPWHGKVRSSLSDSRVQTPRLG